MIVKVESRGGHFLSSWSYYGDVRLGSNSDQTGISFNDACGNGDTDIHMISDDKIGEKILLMEIEFMDGKTTAFYFNGSCFLLNDDGKTIERIN